METAMTKHPLYRYLSVEETSRLQAIAKKQNYKANDTLISIGNRSRDIICIQSGNVSVRIVDSEGNPVEVANLNQGSLIGEMNFIIPTRRTANVVALSDVEAEILPYNQLCDLLRAEPLLASKVFAALNLQLSEKYEGMLSN
jgi:CRP-like cAMP-binding protein